MNRNKVKAHGLTALSDSILIFGTLAVGLSVYEPFTHINESFGVTAAIVGAFVAHAFLAAALTGVFGPFIDRLNAPAGGAGSEDSEGADAKANA